MERVNTVVSQQWWKRPDDDRMLSLEEAYDKTLDRANRCTVDVVPNRALDVTGSQNGGKGLSLTLNDEVLEPTHWSFGQLASRARVPAKWAREDTHPEIAALALNYGLQAVSPQDDSMVMKYTTDSGVQLRAMTGTGYGRIYDHSVVKATMEVNSDDRWKVPAASYATQNPRRASTIYASDRDVFIFLVDPENPIEVPRPDGGEPELLFRGFYVWNSEVGSKTFGIAWFLYRYVCDNRMIWGMEDFHELRIRHTSGGPERFLREGKPLLEKYAGASSKAQVEVFQKAMRKEVGRDDDAATDWLRRNSFNLKEAQRIVAKAKEEEGSSRTVWDLVQGGTALARGIQNTDVRLELEVKASNLLKRVA